MSVFAVSITKDCLWRGSRAEFSNVYHMQTASIEQFDDLAAINYLVDAERPIHSTGVNFLRARSWGPTHQGAGPSKMREVLTLTGSGSGGAGSSIYPELAQMVYWPLGRYGVRNHPQYLRKWLHTLKLYNMSAIGDRYTGTTDAALQTYIDKVTAINPLGLDGPYELCTADGQHLPTGPGKLYPYLEHRQLGR